MPRLKTKEEFILDSRKIHGNKYTYDKVVYAGNKIKVIITCPEHGDFLQTPNDHTGGHNCSKCGLEDHNNYNLKEIDNLELKGVFLDLYVIELFNEKERFIKVGISKEYLKRWRNIKTKSNYCFNQILVLSLSSKEIIILERKLLKDLKQNFRYIPNTKFPGYKECLLFSAKDEILNKIKHFVVKENHRSDLVGKILDYEYK